MGITRVIFGIMYRIGFTPWDGHELPSRLTALASTPGKALDVGCGSGDTAIFLAKHDWDVTAIDFVDIALRRARSKADAAGAKLRFVKADVTKLGSSAVGSGFQLIVDNGCMHGLSAADRDHYVREITAAAAPGARLLLSGFGPGKRRGPTGFDRPEVERRFARDWQLHTSEVAHGLSNQPNDPIYTHELERRA